MDIIIDAWAKLIIISLSAFVGLGKKGSFKCYTFRKTMCNKKNTHDLEGIFLTYLI